MDLLVLVKRLSRMEIGVVGRCPFCISGYS